MISVVNLEEAMGQISQPWSPRDIVRVNDQVVRLALIQGEYHWHLHAAEDELFYVLEGEVVIEVEGMPDVRLGQGEMAVVPKGTPHRPTSQGPSYILMFEPFALKSRGD